MACPLVSGAAALLFAANPDATYLDVKCAGACCCLLPAAREVPSAALLLP